jgi:hypothetical protein
MAFLAVTFPKMRTFAPIAMSAFSAMAVAAVSTLAMSMLVSSATGNDASPISVEFDRPAASATVRLAWIWMGGWFMLQTVIKI